MQSFAELAASRRDWIDTVLRPWCVQASLKDLQRAEAEWMNIAGRVDADATLWTWAWSRFPVLVHDDMAGIDETYQVRVELKDGTSVVGYPDNRSSKRGRLVILCTDDDSQKVVESGPHNIDDIAAVTRL